MLLDSRPNPTAEMLLLRIPSKIHEWDYSYTMTLARPLSNYRGKAPWAEPERWGIAARLKRNEDRVRSTIASVVLGELPAKSRDRFEIGSPPLITATRTVVTPDPVTWTVSSRTRSTETLAKSKRSAE